MTDKDALLREALAMINNLGRREIYEYRAVEDLCARITAALADEPDGWISVSERLPECSSKKDSLGVEVLILPRLDEYGATAFFGRRVTNKPCFYKYGAVLDVTHWQPLPKIPKGADHD